MGKPRKLQDGMWQITIDNKKLFGSKRPTFKAKTKTEVLEWEEDQINAVKDRLKPRSGDRVTRLFNEALDLVLNNVDFRESKNRLQPGSAGNMRRGVEAVRDPLGHLPVEIIDYEQCQKAVSELEERNNNSVGARGRAAIKKAFELATAKGWIARTPLHVPLVLFNPPTDKRDWRGTDEEIEEVLYAQLKHAPGEHWAVQELRYDFLTTLYWTGLRPQEAVAMQWRQFEQRDGSLYYKIDWAWDATAHRLKDPKRKASQRVVILVPDVVEVIKRRWRKQGEPGPDSADFVFQNQQGQPIYHDLIGLYWGAMQKAGKMIMDEKKGKFVPKFRQNDFRHSNISSLFRADVPPHEITLHAGHTRPSFTMDRYGHVTSKKRQVDAALMQLNKASRERRGLPATPEQIKMLAPPEEPQSLRELVLRAEEVFAPAAEDRHKEARAIAHREEARRHYHKIVATETVPQRAARLASQKERSKRYHERQKLKPKKPETPEEAAERKRKHSVRTRRYRAKRALTETPEQREARLAKHREKMRKFTARLTPEEKKARAKAKRQRELRRRAQPDATETQPVTLMT